MTRGEPSRWARIKQAVAALWLCWWPKAGLARAARDDLFRGRAGFGLNRLRRQVTKAEDALERQRITLHRESASEQIRQLIDDPGGARK